METPFGSAASSINGNDHAFPTTEIHRVLSVVLLLGHARSPIIRIRISHVPSSTFSFFDILGITAHRMPNQYFILSSIVFLSLSSSLSLSLCFRWILNFVDFKTFAKFVRERSQTLLPGRATNNGAKILKLEYTPSDDKHALFTGQCPSNLSPTYRSVFYHDTC